LLDPWKGWGWAAFDAEGAAVSTTLCSEMLCPGCTAPLAPSGRLTVITPVVEAPAPLQETTGVIDQADVKIEPEPVEVPKKKKKKRKLKKKAKKKIKV
jgi:hypothetical protein